MTNKMNIQWYGQSCFKIQNSKTTIYTDPFSAEIGLKPPRGKADIVTVSHNHYDHNYIDCLENKPFVIKGPGEYEVKNVQICGINSWHDDQEGKMRGGNTIYTIKIDELTFCHLGDLGQTELEDEQLEKIGEVDILMIPVGGIYTIDGAGANQIINQIESAIAIPMHYKIPGLKIELESIERFLKEMGVKPVPQKEFKIKAGQLPQETEVVVLEV